MARTYNKHKSFNHQTSPTLWFVDSFNTIFLVIIVKLWQHLVNLL